MNPKLLENASPRRLSRRLTLTLATAAPSVGVLGILTTCSFLACSDTDAPTNGPQPAPIPSVTGGGTDGGGGGVGAETGSPAPVLAETLFVAGVGALGSYDVATGAERPGEVQNVVSPVDLQTLSDATMLVNMTDASKVLIVDGTTMLETSRVAASAHGGLRPVHSFLTPVRDGKQYFVSTDDGNAGDVTTDAAQFIDVTSGSPSRFQPAGEVRLGIGHHKVAFSATRQRFTASNISDCDNVVSVYDYTNIASIQPVITWSATQLGWDGSSFAKKCDVTYATGLPPAPHGSATSKLSGKSFTNLTNSGGIVAIAIDAEPPTFTIIATHGSGAGYTKVSDDGHYIYSLQSEPREGSTTNPGAKCQIGQLVVIDAGTSTLIKEVPLLYKGPGCTDTLVGTDAETDGGTHTHITPDGKTMFVTVSGGFQVATARSRQELVLDLTDPANPVQLASIPVGTSTGDHGDALTGDGHFLFVTNTEDNTVTQIDTQAKNVAATIKTVSKPLTVATFGPDGPGHQTGPIH